MKRSGIVLIAVSCLIVALVLTRYFYNLYESKKLVKQFKTTVENIKTNKKETPKDIIQPSSLQNSSLESDTVEIEEDSQNKIELTDSLLGIIRIPSINMEAAILEGMSDDTLKVAIGHDEDSSYPGETGNCVVAGHRAYTYGKLFSRLNEVSVGDIVEVETLEGTFEYTINKIWIVEPDDLSVLETTETPSITMITCTPIYSATHRIIVRGELTKAIAPI